MDSLDSWGRETRIWERLEAWANTGGAKFMRSNYRGSINGGTKTRSIIVSRSSIFYGVKLSALLTETTKLAFHLMHT